MEYFSTISPVFGTGNKIEANPALLCAQALETVRMWEHISSLFHQRSEAPRDLLLFGNADLDHLLGFFTGGVPHRAGRRRAIRLASLISPVP